MGAKTLDYPAPMSGLPSIAALMSPPHGRAGNTFKPLSTSDLPSTGSGRLPCNPDDTLPPMKRSLQCKSDGAPLSPPVSPWTGNHRRKMDEETHAIGNDTRTLGGDDVRDPLLYPEDDTPDGRAFFPAPPGHELEDLVRKHMACQLAPNKTGDLHRHGTQMPTKEEYLLALSCIPVIGRLYNQDPSAYLKRTRDENDEHYRHAKRICGRPGWSTVATPVALAPVPVRSPQPVRRKQVIKRVTMTAPKRPAMARTTPKNSPLTQYMDTPGSNRSTTPDTRAIVKRTDDVDFNALSDYAPPLSTLPSGKASALQVSWQGGPVNLSDDPHRHLLHEAELGLASILRLSCATYLCSKRRIFAGRLNAYRLGKEFRKTDAQQSCKIDVNKASKLWTAYEKVGWFKREHFERFL